MGEKIKSPAPNQPSKMKLTLSFLLLTVAILHASAFPFDLGKLRDQIKDKVAGKPALGQAIAKAMGYMKTHKPDGDVKGWLLGAIDQARDHIENAEDLTQAQKEAALEKGRQFFGALINKVKEFVDANVDNEKIQEKAAELAMKKAEAEAKRLAAQAAKEAEEAAKKAAEDAKNSLGKLFG